MGKIAVAAIVSLWIIPISVLVNRIVPEPYMDEIFHIPQAQQYCKGNFKIWDPMITTPPGLYYLSLAYVATLFPGMFVSKAISFFEVCSSAVLRSTNGVLAVLCSIILYEIISFLRPSLDDRRATLHAVVLALYPLHWFFTFLYYTDVASLTAVLAMYLACLKKKYQLSALLGAFAVVIRQTNIIWMIFVACTGVINMTQAHERGDAKVIDFHVSVPKNDRLTPTSSASMGSNLRKRKSGGAVDKEGISIASTSTFLATQTSGLLGETQAIILTSWHMKWEILVSFSPFFFALVAFVAFVCWNGSVVLGAKEAHAVSPHFAQIMYYSLFSALSSAPLQFTFGQAATLLHSFWKNRPLSLFQGLIALTVGFLSVHFFRSVHLTEAVCKFSSALVCQNHLDVFLFCVMNCLNWFETTFLRWVSSLRSNPLGHFPDITYSVVECSIAHPYLLADNRHYPFYLWRKVIKAHWSMKYLLVPLYVYSWFSIFSVLGKTQRKIWILVYFLATAATLVPAPLIEFRYYSIPFYFMILHCNVTDNRNWLLMGVLYIALNVFTMMMFLFRPFHWNHEPGIQRFIW